jgi:predicted RNase H-like nuclease
MTVSGTPARLAGVDGCRAGWVVCLIAADGSIEPEFRVVARIADLFDDPAAPIITAIDMPIGLPERTGRGGRGPEPLVRKLLGERQSSVFSIVSRSAVFAGEGLDDSAAYRAACTAALATSDPPRKVSRQTFHLFPKIRELDRWLDPMRARSVVESHPELAFTLLNGGRPMTLPKKVKNRANPSGLSERRDLLARLGFDPAVLLRPPRGAGLDDLLDAAVLALVARRVHEGRAVSFPDAPERDARGLPMAITA